MVSRDICKRCGGGWMIEDINSGDMLCDTCYRVICYDGTINDSDCEVDDE